MTSAGGALPTRFALNRREFLRVAGTDSAALAVSELSGRGSVAAETVRHGLSAPDRSPLEALAEALIPEDETVGALGAGAVEYIDRLLGAFDQSVPDLYRGGPFSGRGGTSARGGGPALRRTCQRRSHRRVIGRAREPATQPCCSDVTVKFG